MSKKKLLEGKTKKVYETDVENELILDFKNDFPVGKKGQKLSVREKGAVNNQISAFLFKFIDSYHIPNHFLRDLSKREMVVKRLEMIPLQIMARRITGLLPKNFFTMAATVKIMRLQNSFHSGGLVMTEEHLE